MQREPVYAVEPSGNKGTTSPEGQYPPYRTILVLVSLGLAAGVLLEWLPDEPSPWRWLPLAVVYLAGGTPVARDAWATLREGQLSIDALMGAAALGAAAIGQPVEGAILLFLFSLSNFLESVAMGRTRDALANLRTLHPTHARQLLADGSEVTIAVDDLEPGHRIQVRPGERIAADGVVVSGGSRVDQAAVTGESVPVARGIGDSVFAGTMNQDGVLEVEVDRESGETLLSRVIRLVEEAREQRAPTQRFIDRFAHPYTVGVFLTTALVALVPPLLLGWAWYDALYRAITLLVVASPCALVISTPSALLSAMASGARHGVLFKGGDHLDRAGQVTAIAFDKTGTLTVGTPRLLAMKSTGQDSQPQGENLRRAAAVESPSEHHLARALVAGARERGLELPPVSDFLALPGQGVKGTVEGSLAWVGNEGLASEMGAAVPPELLTWVKERRLLGESVILTGTTGQVQGAFATGDALKPGAEAALKRLRDRGIRKIVVLSGDHPDAVESVLRGIPIDEVLAGLLPPEKVDRVEALEAEGWRVAMVGDGVNDAPALARATLGVAMGAAGTDVAVDTADVILMADDLARVDFALDLGRRARRVVRQNVWASVGWMAVLVVITFWVGLPLPLAVVGHEGSTLLVAVNGLRLLRVQPV